MLPTVKELGELPLRDPRLDSHQARARVEFQNPVKSGKIQNHAVVSSWQGRSIPRIVAGADGIERDFEAGGDLDDRRDLRAFTRPQGPRKPAPYPRGTAPIVGLCRPGIENTRLAEKRAPIQKGPRELHRNSS